MNDLIMARQALQAMDVRAERLTTTRGKQEYKREILTVIGALEGLGYKLPEVDVDLMAKLWSYELKDYVIAFGMDAVKMAVMDYAASDTREYHQFPSVGQIIAQIKEKNRDPRAIIAHAEYEEAIAALERAQEAEIERNMTPELRARLDALYEERIGGKHEQRDIAWQAD